MSLLTRFVPAVPGASRHRHSYPPDRKNAHPTQVSPERLIFPHQEKQPLVSHSRISHIRFGCDAQPPGLDGGGWRKGDLEVWWGPFAILVREVFKTGRERTASGIPLRSTGAGSGVVEGGEGHGGGVDDVAGCFEVTITVVGGGIMFG
jgi:hypothetical protein